MVGQEQQEESLARSGGVDEWISSLSCVVICECSDKGAFLGYNNNQSVGEDGFIIIVINDFLRRHATTKDASLVLYPVSQSERCWTHSWMRRRRVMVIHEECFQVKLFMCDNCGWFEISSLDGRSDDDWMKWGEMLIFVGLESVCARRRGFINYSITGQV